MLKTQYSQDLALLVHPTDQNSGEWVNSFTKQIWERTVDTIYTAEFRVILDMGLECQIQCICFEGAHIEKCYYIHLSKIKVVYFLCIHSHI